MPNWLGDAVMATPALNNLKKHFKDAQFVIIASGAVCAMLEDDPSLIVIEDESKKSKNRIANIFRQAKAINARFDSFEYAFIFTNSIATTLMSKRINTKYRVGIKAGLRNIFLTHKIEVDKEAHQAIIYNQIINKALQTSYPTKKTSLFVNKIAKNDKKRLGLNAGASYGTAKRWDADRFAKVALSLKDEYEIFILGAPNEADIARTIETIFKENAITNYQNLVGKTSLKELLSTISTLDLFITNDSGPMHIAGAFDVPTVAIFGPTKHHQTYQWGNPRFKLVRKEIECAPCMKRDCPLKHHECMKLVEVEDVIDAVKKIVKL
jgi:heptosyltransferase-2